MAALRAAKQALRKEIKKRVAALSDEEKLRQSQVVSEKVNAAVDKLRVQGLHCWILRGSICASVHSVNKGNVFVDSHTHTHVRMHAHVFAVPIKTFY